MSVCGCERRLVSMGIELGGTRRRDETMGGPSGRMSRWMDGWMDGCIKGGTDQRISGRMEERVDRGAFVA